MPRIANYDSSSGAANILIELSSDEGEVALYSDLSATIEIFHWDGDAYTATQYTSGGSAVVLDASNSQAFIQGPGTFYVTKGSSEPLAIYAGAETLVKVSEV